MPLPLKSQSQALCSQPPDSCSTASGLLCWAMEGCMLLRTWHGAGRGLVAGTLGLGARRKSCWDVASREDMDLKTCLAERSQETEREGSLLPGTSIHTQLATTGSGAHGDTEPALQGSRDVEPSLPSGHCWALWAPPASWGDVSRGHRGGLQAVRPPSELVSKNAQEQKSPVPCDPCP